MENEKSKKKNNKITIIMLLIVIILLLLCIFFLLKRNLLDQNSQELIPTGNVDVFDIECNTNCNCTNNTENNNNSNSSNNSNNSNNSNSNSNQENNSIIKEATANQQATGNQSNNSDSSTENDIPNQETENVQVVDSNKVWESTNQLRIFENPVYQMNNIIAPLSTNAYQFVIKNGTSIKVDYTLEFLEENIYRINMKYRLKKNGNYIAGNSEQWVSYQELNSFINSMEAKASDTYYLEWKWLESDNDTQIGATIGASYSLNIHIKAEQKV